MDYPPTTSNISPPTRSSAQTPAPLEEMELIAAISSVPVEFLSIHTSEARRGETEWGIATTSSDFPLAVETAATLTAITYLIELF